MHESTASWWLGVAVPSNTPEALLSNPCRLSRLACGPGLRDDGPLDIQLPCIGVRLPHADGSGTRSIRPQRGRRETRLSLRWCTALLLVGAWAGHLGLGSAVVTACRRRLPRWPGSVLCDSAEARRGGCFDPLQGKASWGTRAFGSACRTWLGQRMASPPGGIPVSLRQRMMTLVRRRCGGIARARPRRHARRPRGRTR